MFKMFSILSKIFTFEWMIGIRLDTYNNIMIDTTREIKNLTLLYILLGKIDLINSFKYLFNKITNIVKYPHDKISKYYMHKHIKYSIKNSNEEYLYIGNKINCENKKYQESISMKEKEQIYASIIEIFYEKLCKQCPNRYELDTKSIFNLCPKIKDTEKNNEYKIDWIPDIDKYKKIFVKYDKESSYTNIKNNHTDFYNFIFYVVHIKKSNDLKTIKIKLDMLREIYNII